MLMCSSDNNSARQDGPASAAARLVQSLRENKATRIAHHEAFAVSRAWLEEKSAPYAGREATRGLGKALGYNTQKGGFLDKFERHRNEYNSLARPVPFSYLDAIGAEPEYRWFPPRWAWKKRRLEVTPVPEAFGATRVK